MKPPIIEVLADFIRRANERRFGMCEWLDGEEMTVYVRRSVPRVLNDGERYTTLDIASIEVHNRGQGVFTRFLEEAHAMHPYQATYIECVQNERFAVYLRQLGLIQVDLPGLADGGAQVSTG